MVKNKYSFRWSISHLPESSLIPLKICYSWATSPEFEDLSLYICRLVLQPMVTSQISGRDKVISSMGLRERDLLLLYE